jgi:hypothetical protein
MLGYEVIKSPTSSQEMVLFKGLFLGVSRQNIRRKKKGWMDDQYFVLCCGPCSTQRQARELVSGPKLAYKGLIIVL